MKNHKRLGNKKARNQRLVLEALKARVTRAREAWQHVEYEEHVEHEKQVHVRKRTNEEQGLLWHATRKDGST